MTKEYAKSSGKKERGVKKLIVLWCGGPSKASKKERGEKRLTDSVFDSWEWVTEGHMHEFFPLIDYMYSI